MLFALARTGVSTESTELKNGRTSLHKISDLSFLCGVESAESSAFKLGRLKQA